MIKIDRKIIYIAIIAFGLFACINLFMTGSAVSVLLEDEDYSAMKAGSMHLFMYLLILLSLAFIGLIGYKLFGEKERIHIYFAALIFGVVTLMMGINGASLFGKVLNIDIISDSEGAMLSFVKNFFNYLGLYKYAGLGSLGVALWAGYILIFGEQGVARRPVRYDFIDKHLNKFSLSVIGIVVMAVALFVVIRMGSLIDQLLIIAENSSLDSIFQLTSMISSIRFTIILLILIDLAVLVQLAASVFAYIIGQKRDLAYVVYMINGGVGGYMFLKMAVLLLKVNSLIALNGSMSSGLELLDMISDSSALIKDALSIIGIVKYGLVIMILAGVFSIYVIYRMKIKPEQAWHESGMGQFDDAQRWNNHAGYQNWDHQGYMPIDDFNNVVSNASSLSKPIKIKKPSRKQLIAIISTVSVIVACIGGYWIYNAFFNFDEIDLMEGMEEPTFYGYDGSGMIDSYPTMGAIDYDKTKLGMEDFMDSITYNVSKSEGLSNDEEIIVTAEYSEKTAKSLKVKIINDSVKIKVSGLTKRFAIGNDIPKENMKVVEEAMDAQAEEMAESRYSYGDKEYTCKRLAILYAHDDNEEMEMDYDDTLIGVYQTVYDGDTEYFLVESTDAVNSETDFSNIQYRSSYFDDHFVYALESYLEDDDYTLTEVGASAENAKTLEDWYTSSYAAVSILAYPATVHPSYRADRWAVIVEKNTVIYEYSYEDKLNKEQSEMRKEEISDVMEGEEEVFSEVASMLEERSNVKEITVKVRYIDGNKKVLYEKEFMK